MGNNSTLEAPQTFENGEQKSFQTSQRLSDDIRANASDVNVPSGKLSEYNVDRQQNDGTTITRYPNGVKYIHSEGGPAVQVEPPPGGSVGTDQQGRMVVYDSNHKMVARMDADKSLHVFSKNGEYVESKDGNVTFKPSGPNSDLQSLHKDGVVTPAKQEDYGISSDGKNVTRFPNGVEYDKATNTVKLPAEYPNATTKEIKDDKGNVVGRSAYDEHGKLLYTQDAKGLHVPTADGELTESRNGTITFESNKTKATKASGALPDVTIDDDSSKSSTAKKPSDPLGEECKDSWDPLCGLDLGSY